MSDIFLFICKYFVFCVCVILFIIFIKYLYDNDTDSTDDWTDYTDIYNYLKRRNYDDETIKIEFNKEMDDRIDQIEI